MAASLMPLPKQHYSGIAGIPLIGGKVYTFAAGTSTPKQTFSDAAGTIPQPNPIILNSRGEPANAIFWNGSYKVELRDALDNLIYTVDNYNTDPFGFAAFISSVAAGGGSALIGFLQAGSGAVPWTAQGKMREQVSLLDFMSQAQRDDVINGIGSIDVTAACQLALNASKNIVVPSGKYRINPVDPNYPTTKYGGGLKPQNGTRITYQGGAQFVMAATDKGEYIFWNLRDTTDVTIVNGDCVGDVGSHTGITGEFGFGYYLASATNPQLLNCKGSKFWGDGVFVGPSIETAGTPTIGGVVGNFLADDNRRQGMSITSWDRGLVFCGEFKNTGVTASTAPSYGIDIEPDANGVAKIDVMLIGVRTSGNAQGGLQIVPGFMSDNSFSRPVFNVHVADYESDADGFTGALRFAYPDLANPDVNVANKVYGQITVDGAKVRNSTGRALDFARWVPTAPKVVINDLYIENPNTSGNVVTNENQCGVVFFLDIANIAYQTSMGAVELNRPTIVDTRAVPKMLAPIWGQTGAGQTIDNLVIRDASGSGWSSAANGLTRITNTANASITYTNPPKRDIAGNDTYVNGAWAGYSIASTVDTVQTLQSAATCVGLEYLFDNRFGVTMTIRPQATDTILMFGRMVNTDIIMRLRGTRLRLKSLGSTFWEATEAVGNLTQAGMDQPRNIFWKNAMPTTGTFTAGDIVFNSTPAIGATPGWVRLTTGSAHVLNTDWRAMPVL